MTSPEKPGDAGPPSLFGVATPGLNADTGAEGLRMLSGLDARSADKRSSGTPHGARRSKRLALALAAVVAVAGVVAWQFTTDTTPPLALSPPAAKSITTAAAPSHTPSPAAAASAMALAAASAPSGAAATIESVAVPSTSATAPPADAAARSSTSVAAMAASDPKASSPSSTGTAHAPKRSDSTRTAHAAHAAAPSARKPSKFGGDPTRLAANAAPTPPDAGRDSDVDLLTAMVTHLESTQPHPGKTVAKRTAVPASPTLVQLVQKCRKLASKDEASCRRQICEGSWGKSPACPSRLAPVKKGTEDE